MNFECGDLPLFSENSTAVKDRLYNFRQLYGPVHALLCMTLCTFGILTNMIHILVLTRPLMRCSSVNVLLSAIAVCDLGTMISYVIYLCHFVLNRPQSACDPSYFSYEWMFTLMMHMTLSIGFHTSSLWLAVAMAFFRLMTLRDATLYSKWQKAQSATKCSIFTFATIFTLCIPTLLSHEVKVSSECTSNYTIGLNGTNNSSGGVVYTLYTLDISALAKDNSCRLYKSNLWLIGIMFKVIPCALLGFLSVGLLIRINKANKNRKKLFKPVKTSPGMNKKRIRRDHTTAMLIGILMIFLITELPQGAIAILNAIFTSDVQTYIYMNLGDLLDLMSLLNSSVNFVLYCVMSSRYRQTFCNILLPQALYAAIYRRAGGPLNPSEFQSKLNSAWKTSSNTTRSKSLQLPPNIFVNIVDKTKLTMHFPRNKKMAAHSNTLEMVDICENGAKGQIPTCSRTERVRWSSSDLIHSSEGAFTTVRKRKPAIESDTTALLTLTSDQERENEGGLECAHMPQVIVHHSANGCEANLEGISVSIECVI